MTEIQDEAKSWVRKEYSGSVYDGDGLDAFEAGAKYVLEVARKHKLRMFSKDGSKYMTANDHVLLSRLEELFYD